MARISPSSSAQKKIDLFTWHLKNHEDLNVKTINEYDSDLRNLAFWFEGSWQEHQEKETPFAPEEITTPTLIHYREYMQLIRKLKPATINRRLLTCKRYFEWTLDQGITKSNPAKPLKLIPEIKSPPRWITDKEEADLVTAVEKNGSLRDQTIIILMLHTGIREMEVCDLTPGDISIGKKSGTLIVRAGKRSKYREVPLNITIRTMLETYLSSLNEETEYLFVSGKTKGRLSERGLRYVIKKYVDKAGLENIRAHDLRHRFGYVMAKRTPIHRLAQIMGHNSLDTTAIYIQATHQDLQEEVEKIAWQ